MTNEIFTMIVKAIITIIIGVASAYLVPAIKMWLDSKFTDSQMALLEDYIHKAVRCAEQYYTQDEWAQKKEFVTNYITEIVNDKFDLTLTSQDIDLLIEGAVNQIKKG